MEQQRKRAQRAALHLLMMARGGGENVAPRRNPLPKNPHAQTKKPLKRVA
jgi:hypothetical protein